MKSNGFSYPKKKGGGNICAALALLPFVERKKKLLVLWWSNTQQNVHSLVGTVMKVRWYTHAVSLGRFLGTKCCKPAAELSSSAANRIRCTLLASQRPHRLTLLLKTEYFPYLIWLPPPAYLWTASTQRLLASRESLQVYERTLPACWNELYLLWTRQEFTPSLTFSPD